MNLFVIEVTLDLSSRWRNHGLEAPKGEENNILRISRAHYVGFLRLAKKIGCYPELRKSILLYCGRCKNKINQTARGTAALRGSFSVAAGYPGP